MPVFDRKLTLDASADVVESAIKLVMTPAPLVERPNRGRALARIGDFLHLFHWSPDSGQMILRYWICHNVVGELEELIDNPALLDEAPALLTDLEYAEVDALALRVESVVGEINPRQLEPKVVPYGMRGLFLWTLFLGIGGVFVAAVNWRRMGRANLFRPTTLWGGIVYLLFALASVLAAVLVFKTETAAYGAELVFRIVTGFALIRWQRPAYERWKAVQPVPSGKQQRGDVVFVLTLIGASGLATFVVAVLLQAFVGATFLNGFEKQFSESGLRLTYPASWSRQAEGGDADFGCEDDFLNTCVVLLQRIDHTGELAIKRQHTLTPPSNPAFNTALTLMGVRLALGAVHYTFDKPVVLHVGGRPAIQQLGHEPSSNAILQLMLIQESSYDTVMLYSLAAEDRGGTVQREIDSIVRSIEFAA